MRAMMMGIHKVIFPENEKTGAIVRTKIGLRLTQQLENRFGILGPEFSDRVDTDYDLEREGKLLDKLPPQQLAQLATEIERLAQRVPLDQGDPHTWEDGEDTKNAATIIALRLLWLTCKYIIRMSLNREVIKEAQGIEDLYYSHIKSLVRLFRGEEAIKEGETF